MKWHMVLVRFNVGIFLFRQIITITAVAILSAHAHAAPDAGLLLQQIDREREISLPRKSTHIEAAPQPLQNLPGQTVIVQGFSFVGNTLLTSEQLSSIIASYLNRPLSFNELQQTAIDVATAYRQAGWVVRAYLPKQDITEGTVVIQIVEAVFGGASIEGTYSRIQQARLLAAIEAAQTLGQPLNANNLDRAILLLDDLPGVAVAGSLQKGAGQNETDLILKVTDEPLISGNVSADNAGAYSVGADRLSGNFYLNSPLGFGDQATANVIHSHGNDYGRLAYSVPVGGNGLRIGAHGSYLEYDLVKGDFEGRGSGRSSTAGLDVSYPLIRSRTKNLYLGLNLDHKAFDNKFDQQTSTRYNIDNLALDLNGNLFDQIGGGGANSLGLTFTQGDIDLSNRDSRNQANTNPLNVGGRFSKFNYRLSRQQAITDVFSAYAAISGQAANDNLDSAEKFYLGGAYGVRAYPANEGGGDDGQLLNLELRARLPSSFNLTGFYDLGHIKMNHNNPVGAGINSYTLKGAGLSLNWQATFGLDLKATWARRIGDNPNPTANGNDQDGTHKNNRFWLNASIAF